MQELLRQIIAELKGSWRFRWIAMAAAWVICLLGWLVVYSLPDSYESEATVYVDTTSALRPILEKLTVGSDVLSRVELVTTAMLGRPLLEKVARETDLYLRASSRVEMDKLIVGMRSRISIENNPRVDPNLYVIRYRDESARTAQAVVAAMLNIFVEDSLGANRLGTQKAQEFLREELAKLQVDLEKSEQELADFKKRNVGRMPGESGDYYARLQSGMEGLRETQSTLQLAQRRRNALMQQLAGEQPMLGLSTGPQSELDERIAQNQTRLEELQLRFTDQHPDVISIKSVLAQLESQKQQQIDELRTGDGTGIASDNPVFQNIQIELTNVNVEIDSLLAQEANQARRVQELRDLADVLPEVEAELKRLTRDYDVTQTQYQSLLQRLEVAELSESAEQSEEVQFRIIDPPLSPLEPASPNRILLLLAVFIVGLGAGGGLSILGNQLRPVFHDSIALREATGLPVLGSVTVMRTHERYASRVRQLSAFGGAILGLCLVCAVVLVFQEPGSLLLRSLIGRGI